MFKHGNAYSYITNEGSQLFERRHTKLLKHDTNLNNTCFTRHITKSWQIRYPSPHVDKNPMFAPGESILAEEHSNNLQKRNFCPGESIPAEEHSNKLSTCICCPRGWIPTEEHANKPEKHLLSQRVGSSRGAFNNKI